MSVGFLWRQSERGTVFSEDFDFSAMNDKFKKGEVWGELGYGSRTAEPAVAAVEAAAGEEKVEAVVEEGEGEEAGEEAAREEAKKVRGGERVEGGGWEECVFGRVVPRFVNEEHGLKPENRVRHRC